MKLVKESMSKLNKIEKLPVFTGIFYNYKSQARKMTEDEDEFVDIEEDDDDDLTNDNKNVHNNNNKNQNQYSVQPQKKIDDLFDLLNTIPVEAPTTNIGSINMNANYSNMNTIIPNGTINEKPKFNIENIINSNIIYRDDNVNQNNEEDEFVDIVEDNPVISYREINNSCPIENKETKVKEINFQDLIMQTGKLNHAKAKDNTEIIKEENNFNGNKNSNNYIASEHNVIKSKVSLDDLFCELEINTTPVPTTNINNINNATTTTNIGEIIFDNVSNNDQVVDVDHKEENLDEFCDVEENITENLYSNSITKTDNVFNCYGQIENYTINFAKDQNDKSKIEFIEHKKEEPKISIINYTQDDFLNEFMKENKIIHAEGVNINETDKDDFNFVEENENANNIQQNEDLNLSTIDLIFKYKLKEEFIISKFKENISKIKSNLSKELITIEKSLSKLIEFLNANKQFSQAQFEKDRKLINFLNSTVQFLFFIDKFNSLLSELREKSDTSMRDKILFKLKTLIKTPTGIFPISQVMDIDSLNKLEQFSPKITCESKNIKTIKICHICLHKLEEEAYTNAFSFDFHVTCINFWLNLVDNQSPYIQNNKTLTNNNIQ